MFLIHAVFRTLVHVQGDQTLYFLHSTFILSFYIDVVFTIPIVIDPSWLDQQKLCFSNKNSNARDRIKQLRMAGPPLCPGARTFGFR